MHGRHLLGLRETGPDEIRFLLDAAAGPLEPPSPVRGKTVALAFFETDARTRLFFDRACRALAVEPLALPLGAGDGVAEAARTARALGADALVVRHPRAGAPWGAARAFDGPVVNAGDGANEHPTRGLLDLLTLRARRPRLEEARVAIVGDIASCAPGRSFAWGLLHLGATVTLVGPPTMVPDALARCGFRVTHDLEGALRDSDALYVLPLTPDGPARGLYPSVSEYVRLFGIDERRLERIPRDLVVLHAGPVGREACGELGLRALAERQLADGPRVCAAVLELVLGGSRHAVAA